MATSGAMNGWASATLNLRLTAASRPCVVLDGGDLATGRVSP